MCGGGVRGTWKRGSSGQLSESLNVGLDVSLFYASLFSRTVILRQKAIIFSPTLPCKGSQRGRRERREQGKAWPGWRNGRLPAESGSGTELSVCIPRHPAGGCGELRLCRRPLTGSSCWLSQHLTPLLASVASLYLCSPSFLLPPFPRERRSVSRF